MAIQKKIHYCWFGGNPLPPLAKKCIDSWKRNCPEYEIIEWNENNFNLNINSFVEEAYGEKKYAFVTDYVRLYALYHHGGIYLDTDVEVIKSFYPFLDHNAFIGCENENLLGTGIMAAERNHPWVKDLLDLYKDMKFVLPDGVLNTIPNPEIITKMTIEEYRWVPGDNFQLLKDGLNVYPFSVFCAKDFKTGKVIVTDETYTIHHFSGSWLSKSDKVKASIIRFLGPKLTKDFVEYKKKLRRFISK